MSAIVEAPFTFAELLDNLGGIPAHRVLMRPPPGTATEADALQYIEGNNKRLVELIDGTLVEKAMGAGESSIAMRINGFIFMYLQANELGVLLGEAGPLRMVDENIRMPDVSFVAWKSMPGGVLPTESVWNVPPSLTVEVLSGSNTPKEIDRKLEEYFDRGCKLSWIVDPETKTVRVHTSLTKFKTLTIDDTLTGGSVLPGFKLKVADLFGQSKRRTKK